MTTIAIVLTWRALTDTFLRRKAIHLVAITPQEFFLDPVGYLRALGRIDESKQNDMAEEHPPMRIEAAEKTPPIQVLRASKE